MARRIVLWSSVLLGGALLAASAPWSRVLPACNDVPAAEREGARLAGRCEGRAPIVNVAPNSRRPATAPRRPVPDLRGRPFDQRDERLARYIVAIDYRQSAQRRDWVIDQVPRPPATLPEGGNLRLVLSDGALVRVPDVRGGFARALVTLHRAGLSWIAGDGPAGPVVGQVPAPGVAVKPGAQVVLRLATPGPVALAPESTRPDVAPPVAPPARPPSAGPSAPPAGAAPGATVPPTTAPTQSTPQPAPQTTPAMTAMPDVQGMIFDVARVRLAGFPVQRVHRAGAEPGGTVIGQSPAAGAAVAPGTPVRLVLSDGSLVRVPRVMSFTLNEARQRLAAGELRPVIVNVPSDAPAGTVMSQQPAEGQVAQRGTSIRLNVSSGPAATAAAPAKASLAVPNLVGSTYERVRPQLDRFRVERSERAAREPVGTVLEQVPAAGTKVEPGSTVSITVSSGGRPETIEVTNVVGQATDAATGALSEFRIERVAEPSTEPAGRVLGQEPSPGTAVAPGSTVRLRVSDGSRVPAPAFARMTLAQARDAARAAGLSLALSEGRDDPGARVKQQDPAPGSEVARGSTLRVAVENRMLPFAVPPAARDAWDRASGFVLVRSARDVAIAVVAMLALLALLLLARRRPRERFVATEPVFSSTRTPPTEPVFSSTRVTATESPVPKPAPVRAATRPPPAPARRTGPVLKPVAPVQALPPRFAKSVPPPAAPTPEPDPVVFGAAARLEADSAATVAPTAAPRGPEICIAARLQPGEASVRELPAETAPDELTEESK
ncbi:MAG: PASTA domain-containing protein [Burkholderiaceae bacterium]